jgi:hypothetical protein
MFWVKDVESYAAKALLRRNRQRAVGTSLFHHALDVTGHTVKRPSIKFV